MGFCDSLLEFLKDKAKIVIFLLGVFILTLINQIWVWVDNAFTIGSLFSIGITLTLLVLVILTLRKDEIRMAQTVGALLFGSLIIEEINAGLATFDFDTIEMAFDFKPMLGMALLFAIFASISLIVLLASVVMRLIKFNLPIANILHAFGLFASCAFLFLAMIFLFIGLEKFDFQMFLQAITSIAMVVALSSIYLVEEEKEEVPPQELDNTSL